MSDRDEVFRAEFALLLQSYLAELPQTMLRARALWERLGAAGWDADAWESLHRLIHSLAGSGTSFGFPMITAAARAFDIQLKAIIQAASAPDASRRQELAALLDLLELAAGAAEHGAAPPAPIEGAPAPPLAAAPGAAAAAQPTELSWLQAIEPDHDVAAAARIRILIVDDDFQFQQMLALWLKARGYQVDAAASGEEALARLDAGAPPDLVLLDVLLPGLSGLQTLELIRDQAGDIAIVLITAFGSELVALNALRRGADDYLPKPFGAREFQAVLQRTLDRLLLRRQNAALRAQVDAQHRQLEAELSRAARVQAELLPSEVPRLAGFELAARCIPAREVGGDFYDWQLVAHNLLNLTLGDVMGKGMPAALLMTTARATLHAVPRPTPPGTTIQALAAAMEADLVHAGSFVTLLHAQLNIARRRVTYVDAGHGHVFIRRASGAAVALPARGMPLGIVAGQTYMEGTVDLQPGDALVLYSDGLVDMWPQPEHHRNALADMLAHTHGAQAMVDRLVALPALLGPLDDDLTVVVLYCTGS